MKMRTRWTCPVVLVWLASAAIGAFAAESSDVAAPNAEVKKLAGDFRFVEGPAADAEGNVYFSDIPNNRIHKWSFAENRLSTHRENSGGANGLFFDQAGNLIACEGGARQMTQDNRKGEIVVLAKEYGGKRFNSPNDLWVDPKNGIYFTDPFYGPKDTKLEMDGMHVYYIGPDRKKVIRVTSDLVQPNGLIGTPDGKTLYIADPGSKKTWAYTIQSDGTLADKQLLTESGSDGMTMDEKGNIYITAGGVKVYNPSGKLIQEIKTPESPANVTFAGPDFRTLFITARTSVYAVPMSVKGAKSTNWRMK
jgi:gluconolactonase